MEAQARTVTTVFDAVSSVGGKCDVVVRMLGEVGGPDGLQHLLASSASLLQCVTDMSGSLAGLPDALARATAGISESVAAVGADVARCADTAGLKEVSGEG
jgi:hypothetical protein